jgi:CelD/BcsL family acetyltransferase involved in cellulose biosynthesis
LSVSIEIKAPADFTEREISLWNGFRAANPALYSPYFHFGYTELLGRLRQDVHVLIIKQDNAPMAFLPFQARLKTNGKIGFARPIGAPMTDYHGFIRRPDADLDILPILKQSGFGAFHFSALIDQGGQLSNYASSRTACAVADISDGAEKWREARDSSYRRHLKSNRRRIRNAEEIGERRTVFKSNDQAVFDQLIAWKREKFAETGKYDVLSADWTMSLLEELWSRDNMSDLRADMHALYFGDRLAAIDLGLTDGTVFHSWMVAYDNDLQHLAPGIQLLEGLIDAGQELGYTRIDLGEGLDGYKRHYASEEVYVGSGFIAASGSAAALSKIYGATEKFGEQRLGNLGKLPGKARRRYAQIRACEPDFGGRAKAVLAAVTGSRK